MPSRAGWLPLTAFLLAALLLPAAAAGQKQSASVSKYIGPGSCSATACHGGVQPRNVTRVLQNEYSTWAVQDSHAKAYRSLENSVSQRMGRILGLNPASSQRCLTCHALNVSAGMKGREFDLSEGVSCESCHGPASAWLGPHTVKSWTHEQSLQLGMLDLRSLSRRSENCLDCHLGTAEKEVNHEMIAAGHPDLVFELDSYTAIMPPHWKLPAEGNFGARAWSIGQATQLRDAMKRLARHVQSPKWPEYAELDCFACHHSLTKPENSWRQERGYPQSAYAGAPPYNTAHYAVARILAKEVDASAAQELERDLTEIYRLIAKPDTGSNKNDLQQSVTRAGDVANRFAGAVESASFDRGRTARLMHAITAQAETLADEDTRTAEQAAMSLDALFISYSKEGGEKGEVRNAINALFQQLQNPSGYSGPRFKEQLRRVGAALRDAGI